MLVSVIVPMYNIENEVEACIESILAQTYNNFELIIVNDGSDDNTLKLAQKYDDERIKIYTTENKGLGEARNFGFSKSKGDFVCFIDGDDTIEVHYLANLTKWAKKGYDIVVCDYNLVFTNKNGLNPLKKIANKMVSPKRFKGVNNRLVLNYRYLAWNKLYKRELLEDFSWGSGAHEDIAAIKILFDEPNIKYIQDKLYNYYKRSDSLSTSTSVEKLNDIRTNYNYVLNFAGEFKNTVYLRQYSSLLMNTVDLYKEDPKKLEEEVKSLNNEFSSYIKDKKLLSKLGIAKKKYVEAGIKNDIKRLLFVNKFVSK